MLLYLIGFIAAIGSAWILSTIVRIKERSYFMMELPLYRIPRWNTIGLHIIEKPMPMAGAEFRFLRKQMGLTRQALATLMHTTHQTVASYESNKTKPGPSSEKQSFHSSWVTTFCMTSLRSFNIGTPPNGLFV